MAWSIMLIVVAVLFAAGFIWPGLWFFALAVFVLWLVGMVVWGVSGRRGSRTTVEGERPRHRVE
jgi:hypothetical protein